FFLAVIDASAFYPLSLHDALPISNRSVWSSPSYRHPAACSSASVARAAASAASTPDRVASGSTAETGRSAGTPPRSRPGNAKARSEEHTSELQSRRDLVCRLLLEK